MSTAQVTAKKQRLCGHVDLFSFSNAGRSGRLNDRVHAANTVCGDCRKRISGLLNTSDSGYYPVALPALIGRDKAVSWANSIRLRTLRSLGPVMANLKISSDPMASAVLAAYEMLFKIPSATFWISGKEFTYDGAWAIHEVEHLMRSRPLSTVCTSPTSAFDYWTQTDRSVIAQAKESAQALLQCDVVPTADDIPTEKNRLPALGSLSIFI